MQIGGEDIGKYVCEYGVENKKTFKKTQIQKYTFLCLLENRHLFCVFVVSYFTSCIWLAALFP